MTIRAAVAGDVPDLVEMGAAFVRDSAYAGHLTLSPPHVAALAERLIADPEGIVLVAQDRGGALVGMLALKVYEHPMSGQRTATEFVWWVDPVHRGSIGVRLLKAAEGWATDVGATVLQMIAPTPRVEEFYARVGFVPLERTFQKRMGTWR